MRVFFQTFLYVNVGIGALFFGIWLWTAFPFSLGAQAEEPFMSSPVKSPKGLGSTAKSKGVLPDKSQQSSNNTNKKKGITPQLEANKLAGAGAVSVTKGNQVPSQGVAPKGGGPQVLNPGNKVSQGVAPKSGVHKVLNPGNQASSQGVAPKGGGPQVLNPGNKVSQGVAPKGGGPQVLNPGNKVSQGVAPKSGVHKVLNPGNQASSQGVAPKGGVSQVLNPGNKVPQGVAPKSGGHKVLNLGNQVPSQGVAPKGGGPQVLDSGNKVSQGVAPKSGVHRAPASDNLPVPPPPSSPSVADSPNVNTDFNTQLKSAQKLAKQEGAASASVASGLMDVNQRVVEIHKMLSNYEYDPSDRRDPFIPFRPKGLEEAEEIEVLNHATSGYELSEIKLIGIKWGKGPGFSKAMFRTPDSEIHYLQAKDRIGSGGAIIDRLGEDKVVVLEPRFALESQTTSSAVGGSARVFVPKIIYLSRFAQQMEPKKQEIAKKSAPPSPVHSTLPGGGTGEKNKGGQTSPSQGG